jgi:cytochrome c oxidase subunit 2
MEDQTENHVKKGSSFNPLLIVGIVIILGVAAIVLIISSKKKPATPMASHETMNMQSQTQTSQQVAPTQATQAAQSDAPAVTISVEGGNYFFKPNEIRVKKGQKVTIIFTNAGGIHDFVIDEFNVRTQPIPGGQTATISFTPDKTGSFEFYCSVANHRQMGMKGTLIVE